MRAVGDFVDAPHQNGASVALLNEHHPIQQRVLERETPVDKSIVVAVAAEHQRDLRGKHHHVAAFLRRQRLTQQRGPLVMDQTNADQRQALRSVNFLPYPEQLYLEVCGLLFPDAATETQQDQDQSPDSHD